MGKSSKITITFTADRIPPLDVQAELPDKPTGDYMLDEAKKQMALVWQQHDLQVKLAQAGGKIVLQKESR